MPPVCFPSLSLPPLCAAATSGPFTLHALPRRPFSASLRDSLPHFSQASAKRHPSEGRVRTLCRVGPCPARPLPSHLAPLPDVLPLTLVYTARSVCPLARAAPSPRFLGLLMITLGAPFLTPGPRAFPPPPQAPGQQGSPVSPPPASGLSHPRCRRPAHRAPRPALPPWIQATTRSERSALPSCAGSSAWVAEPVDTSSAHCHLETGEPSHLAGALGFCCQEIAQRL